MKNEILITDIAERVMDGRISASGDQTGSWSVFDYEMEGIGSGRAVGWNAPNSDLEDFDSGRAVAGSPYKPGPLTIRLGATGRYRISFITRYSDVTAKLSGDGDFSTCAHVHAPLDREEVRKGFLRGSEETVDSLKEGWCDAEEVFWREADLTGKDLILEDRNQVCIMAVRLAPAITAADARTGPWPIAATVDSGIFMEKLHATPDDLFTIPERVPGDCNVRLLIVQAGSSDVLYNSFTQVGTEAGESFAMGVFGETNSAANLKRYHAWGVNPMKALAEYAHRRGWQLHVYFRLRGGTTVFPSHRMTPVVVSKFYAAHPEYSLRDRDGTRVEGFSVAYPEVRDHLCRLYAEVAGYGVDGVNLCFIRGSPVVLYEPAMVDGFRSRYGLDPRPLRDDDPRWFEYRAGVVNTWMREVKKAIGPGCALSAMVHGTPALNRRFGMDVATWVKEGIVSDLILTADRYDKYGIHSHGYPEDLDYPYFQNLPGRENVRLWPMFFHWDAFNAEPDRYYAALQKCMHAGADGYATWDGPAMGLLAKGPLADLAQASVPWKPSPDRLLGKYDIVRWCGYRWKGAPPIEGW